VAHLVVELKPVQDTLVSAGTDRYQGKSMASDHDTFLVLAVASPVGIVRDLPLGHQQDIPLVEGDLDALLLVLDQMVAVSPGYSIGFCLARTLLEPGQEDTLVVASRLGIVRDILLDAGQNTLVVALEGTLVVALEGTLVVALEGTLVVALKPGQEDALVVASRLGTVRNILLDAGQNTLVVALEAGQGVQLAAVVPPFGTLVVKGSTVIDWILAQEYSLVP
jgi:hypothetical protein